MTSRFSAVMIGDSADCAAAHDRMVADDDAYRQDWAEAHGYLPRTERPPLPPAHLCPAQYGYLVRGSRVSCPHCKIAAPLDAGPGIE